MNDYQDESHVVISDEIKRILEWLAAKGLIVDSGKRRNGHIVWVANKDNGFTDEQTVRQSA
jgi:hypothetical protein